MNFWYTKSGFHRFSYQCSICRKHLCERDDVQAVRDVSQPLQPVNGSIKKSKLKANTKMVYDADMQWGKAYVFLSGSKNGFHIPMHAAMDNGEKFKRGSMEFRCIAGKRNNSDD